MQGVALEKYLVLSSCFMHAVILYNGRGGRMERTIIIYLKGVHYFVTVVLRFRCTTSSTFFRNTRATIREHETGDRQHGHPSPITENHHHQSSRLTTTLYTLLHQRQTIPTPQHSLKPGNQYYLI
jgi:hypothetical protein